MHRAFGRNAGLSKQQLHDLAALDRSDFDERDFAALNWARALLTHPEGVPADIQKEYELALSPEERAAIGAAFKSMFCTNLAVNTMLHLLARVPGGLSEEKLTACELPAAD